MLGFAFELFAVVVFESFFEVFDFGFESVFLLLKLESDALVVFSEFVGFLSVVLGE